MEGLIGTKVTLQGKRDRNFKSASLQAVLEEHQLFSLLVRRSRDSQGKLEKRKTRYIFYVLKIISFCSPCRKTVHLSKCSWRTDWKSWVRNHYLKLFTSFQISSESKEIQEIRSFPKPHFTSGEYYNILCIHLESELVLLGYPPVYLTWIIKKYKMDSNDSQQSWHGPLLFLSYLGKTFSQCTCQKVLF